MSTLTKNDTGFHEYGFDIEYSAKAPSGYYGMRIRRDIQQRNNNYITLYGTREFQVIVRDDLTDLVQFTNITSGYKMVI